MERRVHAPSGPFHNHNIGSAVNRHPDYGTSRQLSRLSDGGTARRLTLFAVKCVLYAAHTHVNH
jgi:hypothetical protein